VTWQYWTQLILNLFIVVFNKEAMGYFLSPRLKSIFYPVAVSQGGSLERETGEQDV